MQQASGGGGPREDLDGDEHCEPEGAPPIVATQMFPQVPWDFIQKAELLELLAFRKKAQLSPLAHTVHHMGQWVCAFVVNECVDVHNGLAARRR